MEHFKNIYKKDGVTGRQKMFACFLCVKAAFGA